MQEIAEPRHRPANVLSAVSLPTEDSLYLDRCQVDTPLDLVQTVWNLVHAKRSSVGDVVDFGAGDARFAFGGNYRSYTGYEIDPDRCASLDLPIKAAVVNACAFSEHVANADLSIGNPPYVRNQDLPTGWRQNAAKLIHARTQISISGLANAWQYFFFLSLASTKDSGLVALVIPYEWVSRPSSAQLREYIKSRGWQVDVYRLADDTFDGVLTTASITIIDKGKKTGLWNYYRGDQDDFKPMRSPTGNRRAPLKYVAASDTPVSAKRGLSPGTQTHLTLTEGERARYGLRIGRDVVRCVTSLRATTADLKLLDEAAHDREFVSSGKKCWLVRTDKKPSQKLQDYFDSVPESERQTSTCLSREIWWRFTMPKRPGVLMATGFRKAPKVLVNAVGAVAVGSACGIYTRDEAEAKRVAGKLREIDYDGRVVSHSNGLKKLEIHQINALLSGIIAK